MQIPDLGLLTIPTQGTAKASRDGANGGLPSVAQSPEAGAGSQAAQGGFATVAADVKATADAKAASASAGAPAVPEQRDAATVFDPALLALAAAAGQSDEGSVQSDQASPSEVHEAREEFRDDASTETSPSSATAATPAAVGMPPAVPFTGDTPTAPADAAVDSVKQVAVEVPNGRLADEFVAPKPDGPPAELPADTRAGTPTGRGSERASLAHPDSGVATAPSDEPSRAGDPAPGEATKPDATVTARSAPSRPDTPSDPDATAAARLGAEIAAADPVPAPAPAAADGSPLAVEPDDERAAPPPPAAGVARLTDGTEPTASLAPAVARPGLAQKSQPQPAPTADDDAEASSVDATQRAEAADAADALGDTPGDAERTSPSDGGKPSAGTTGPGGQAVAAATPGDGPVVSTSDRTATHHGGEAAPQAGSPAGAAPTAARSAPPAEAMVAYQARAAIAEPPAQQLAVRVVTAAADDLDRITVDLKPETLGRVSVQLDLTNSKHVVATITVDRQETLDLLRQDARGLERALQDAGLRTDGSSLSFNLRGDGQNAGGGFASPAHSAPTQGQPTTDIAKDEPAAPPPPRRSGVGLIDIRV